MRSSPNDVPQHGFRDSNAGMQCLSNHEMKVRFMPETHHFLGFHFRQFTKEFRGRGRSFERVGRNDFLGREANHFAKDFGGL